MTLINPSPVIVARQTKGRRKEKDNSTGDDGREQREDSLLQRNVAVATHALFWQDETSFMMMEESESNGIQDHNCNEELEERERIDTLEIFEHIRDIKDPEHPYSLEQLSVVGEEKIFLDEAASRIVVSFTPTVQHCSMATLIGLSLRVKLMRVLPARFKVDIRVTPGSHASEGAVNKQLNDKERVCAALENPNLIDMVEKCISGSE